MNKARTLRPITLAAMFALALAGCQQAATPEAQQSETAEATGPDAKPGISARDARLVLPAIPGRPGVAYFVVRNGGDATATLAGVHIEGAGNAEMHRTEGGKMRAVERLDIAAGADASFEPGGLHVMAFDLATNLAAGGETELTLTFADGDKISLPVTIEAMGAMAAPGMKH